MATSQVTLLISSKHDLLFIAAECLQGSMVCHDGYLCDRSPLFPACHIEFCRSALNFPWAAGPGPGGQFRISLCQNYISVRRRRPLCMPLMDCSFSFSPWWNWESMTSWLRGQRLWIQWALMAVWEASSLWSVPEPLVMRKINFDCCSRWTTSLRAILYSCRGGRFWRIIEHGLD